MIRWLPGETFAEYLARAHRRRLWLERAGIPALAVLVLIGTWVAVNFALGGAP